MSGINIVSIGSNPVIPQPTEHAAAATPKGGQVGNIPQPQGGGQTSMPATPDQLQKTLDRMNQQLDASNKSVRIGYASEAHQLTVQVVDNTTGQVVGQFPSKSVLASEAATNQFIGLMLSKEA